MTIQEAIRQMAQDGLELYCKVCTVSAVDEHARTIDCTPIDEGAPLLGVNLQAGQQSKDGFVQYPSIDSHVVVGFLSESVAVMLVADKIDKTILKIGDMSVQITQEGITFNGGALGGLVKIHELTEKLNDLITAFNSHTHEIMPGSVAVVGTATAQSNPAVVVVPAITTPHVKIQVSDYENDKVKHG